MYPEPPSHEEVREELNHVFTSPAFPANEKRRAFLRFIVEETLAGRSANLKGFTIAVSVFDRDESFDASSDPVVRIEARRLRRDLDSYYMHAGKEDSVRISIPKGAYIPHFETAELPKPQKGGRQPGTSPAAGSGANPTMTNGLFQRKWIITASVILAIIVIINVAWLQVDKSKHADSGESAIEPTVLVLPFEALGPNADSRYLAAGISQELITELMRFPNLRLYVSLAPRASEANEANKTLVEKEITPDATYLVSGSVRVDGKQVHVVPRMVFAATGRIVWTETYDRDLNPDAMVQLQSDLAENIATKLGQTYGYIHTDVENRKTKPEVSNMQSYLCVQSALVYRRNFSLEQIDPLIECLEKAITSDPRYSDAWAMLGWLHLDAGRFKFNGREQVQQEYETALQFAARAVSLAPDNTLALKALSSINYYMGHFEESERLARRAVALNPNDPDTLAQLGWRLSARGDFEEGLPLLQSAIDRAVNPPGWYFNLVAIHLYMSGQYQQMLGVAERSAADDSELGQALVAIACGALNDRVGARQALEKIPDNSIIARDPAAYLRRNGAVDEIVDALMTGLAQAKLVAFGTPG